MSSVLCWKCQESLPLFADFCLVCGTIQEPISINKFEVFNLPALYSIDMKNLEQTYIRRQTRIHPDRFALASEKEKLYANQWASQLNEAYQVLKDPLTRAHHLLEINQVPVEFKEDISQDGDLLMEMMDLREGLEMDPNAYADKIKKRISVSLGALSKAFECKDFVLARKQLYRLKYLKRLQDS